jgi:hypothetical protein
VRRYRQRPLRRQLFQQRLRLFHFSEPAVYRRQQFKCSLPFALVAPEVYGSWGRGVLRIWLAVGGATPKARLKQSSALRASVFGTIRVSSLVTRSLVNHRMPTIVKDFVYPYHNPRDTWGDGIFFDAFSCDILVLF